MATTPAAPDKDVIKAPALNLTKFTTGGATGVALVLVLVEALFSDEAKYPNFSEGQWAALLTTLLITVTVVVSVDMWVRAYATAHTLCCDSTVRLPDIKGSRVLAGADKPASVVAVRPGGTRPDGIQYLVVLESDDGFTTEWVDSDQVEFGK